MSALQKIFISSFVAFAFFSPINANAQLVTLSANGPGNTYEEITAKFAPGNGINAVEHAECSTAHPGFGRHVAEVFDATLNKFVFSFYIHVAEDNDRCTTATDRQRVEIKTYESSPANLKGTVGESITYKWFFKIPLGFKVSTSFTHIHQIKPVNGDDGNPLFTLTARKGSSGNPNALELIVNNTLKVATPALSEFAGEWVEATEFITVGANGVYSMKVRRLSDNAMLIDYTNMNIMTIRPDNDFIRPKWGIYRSLNSPADLRDDSLQFADFSIEEGTVLATKLLHFSGASTTSGNLLKWKTANDVAADYYQLQRSTNGRQFSVLATIPALHSGATENNYEFTDAAPIEKNYYRLQSFDKGGNYSSSEIVLINSKKKAIIQIFPNPVINKVQVAIAGFSGETITARIIGKDGKILYIITDIAGNLQSLIADAILKLKPAGYVLQLRAGAELQQIQLLKQ